MHEIPTMIMAAGLIAALGYATWTDVRARIIPNPLNAAIALAAPVWWWASGLEPWPGAAIQVAMAIAALIVFIGIFALGAMGGGDVKLIGALGLWLMPVDMLRMLVWMSLAGGAITIGMLIAHKIRKIEGRPEIPYGVAIALATAPLITERYIYHFR